MCRAQLLVAMIAGLILFPQGQPEAAEPAADAAARRYAEQFRELLDTAFGETAPDAQAAERHYRALQSLRDDDPRAAYGYGLVLMKLHKHSDGMALIEQAAAVDPPYLPAQRAVIRETIRRGDNAAALQQMARLAQQIAAPDRRNDFESKVTADWIGMAIEFLAGPAELSGLDDEILEADAAIRRALPADLQQLYDQGQQQTQSVVLKLDARKQAAAVEAEQTLQEEQSATQARLDASKSRQEELQEAKKQQQLRVVDTSASLEDQLEQVSDRFESLNRSATSLLQSIQAAQLAIQQLRTQADARSNNNNNNQNNRFIEAQILSRSRELDVYVGEYATTLQSRETTARQGQALVARWKATMNQARRSDTATQAQLQKFEKLNENLVRSLQEAKQSLPRSRQMRTLAKRRRSLTTYDPFDLDQEQQRLAAELKLADN